MHIKFIRCVACDREYPRERLIYRCQCGEALEIVYDYDEIRGKVAWKTLRNRPFRHWRYREFLPILSDAHVISMDEGGTPLLLSRNLGRRLGVSELYFKCEGLNPTGSFKDRGTTIEVSKAVEYGSHEVVVASTGNMGASIAAYTALAKLKTTIYVPKGATASAKIRQMRAYGADVTLVEGDYTHAMKLAVSDFDHKGLHLLGDYPYRGEGEKTVGYEIVDQCDGKVSHIIAPIGNGTLLAGIWKGIKDLEKVGLITERPRLVGVQAAGCQPVARAFLSDHETIIPVTPRTKATAMACGDPLDGRKALKALRESDGTIQVVSDAELVRARQLLAQEEGIYAELSGAAPLAGLLKLKSALNRDACVVLVISGTGLKD